MIFRRTAHIRWQQIDAKSFEFLLIGEADPIVIAGALKYDDAFHGADTYLIQIQHRPNMQWKQPVARDGIHLPRAVLQGLTPRTADECAIGRIAQHGD